MTRAAQIGLLFVVKTVAQMLRHRIITAVNNHHQIRRFDKRARQINHVVDQRPIPQLLQNPRRLPYCLL